jgi:hypothetical protein
VSDGEVTVSEWTADGGSEIDTPAAEAAAGDDPVVDAPVVDDPVVDDPVVDDPVADNTVGFLAGDWNVLRWISDHRTGTDGEFRGTASFRPRSASSVDLGELEYTEQGELAFGSHLGPASRTLTYCGRADGAADVSFTDGRPFFRLDLRTGHCEAEHPCNADQYLVTVTRQGRDRFTERWQVAGPEKNYEMTATYTRCDDDAGPVKN